MMQTYPMSYQINGSFLVKYIENCIMNYLQHTPKQRFFKFVISIREWFYFLE